MADDVLHNCPQWLHFFLEFIFYVVWREELSLINSSQPPTPLRFERDSNLRPPAWQSLRSHCARPCDDEIEQPLQLNASCREKNPGWVVSYRRLLCIVRHHFRLPKTYRKCACRNICLREQSCLQVSADCRKRCTIIIGTEVLICLFIHLVTLCTQSQLTQRIRDCRRRSLRTVPKNGHYLESNSRPFNQRDWIWRLYKLGSPIPT